MDQVCFLLTLYAVFGCKPAYRVEESWWSWLWTLRGGSRGQHTFHKVHMLHTAPHVPQKKRGRLGICLQSHIIAGGACKVNWANLIFMVEPFAAVMRNPFSLLQTPPPWVFSWGGFTGNRTLNSIQCQFGYWIACQNSRVVGSFCPTTRTALSKESACFFGFRFTKCECVTRRSPRSTHPVWKIPSESTEQK